MHIAPSCFRSEAAQIPGPIGRSDLVVALQQAYAIRSRYVHTLQEIPSQLTVGSMPEMVEEDARPTLSVSGLARVARHIIMQFVVRGPIVVHEDFDYRRSFPNIITVRLASECWIANTGGFTYKHGPQKLTALIEQITSAVLLRTSKATMTDIRPVLALIEDMMPGLQKVNQRLPFLTLYFPFHQWRIGRLANEGTNRGRTGQLCSPEARKWTIYGIDRLGSINIAMTNVVSAEGEAAGGVQGRRASDRPCLHSSGDNRSGAG
ncbi:MAG: hypothetical protein AB7V46_05255 [Thermomicrobiales bacterium]